jgi:hypothetical protein
LDRCKVYLDDECITPDGWVSGFRHDDAGLTYAQWISSLAASGNVGAMRVKIADITDDSNPERLAQLEPDQAKSLGKRYEWRCGG